MILDELSKCKGDNCDSVPKIDVSDWNLNNTETNPENQILSITKLLYLVLCDVSSDNFESNEFPEEMNISLIRMLHHCVLELLDFAHNICIEKLPISHLCLVVSSQIIEIWCDPPADIKRTIQLLIPHFITNLTPTEFLPLLRYFDLNITAHELMDFKGTCGTHISQKLRSIVFELSKPYFTKHDEHDTTNESINNENHEEICFLATSLLFAGVINPLSLDILPSGPDENSLSDDIYSLNVSSYRLSTISNTDRVWKVLSTSHTIDARLTPPQHFVKIPSESFFVAMKQWRILTDFLIDRGFMDVLLDRVSNALWDSSAISTTAKGISMKGKPTIMMVCCFVVSLSPFLIKSSQSAVIEMLQKQKWVQNSDEAVTEIGLMLAFLTWVLAAWAPRVSKDYRSENVLVSNLNAGRSWKIGILWLNMARTVSLSISNFSLLNNFLVQRREAGLRLPPLILREDEDVEESDDENEDSMRPVQSPIDSDRIVLTRKDILSISYLRSFFTTE